MTAPVTPTVAFCRVASMVEPEVRFEVWMPAPDKWNGKFNGVGNGRLAGSIGYAAMNTARTRAPASSIPPRFQVFYFADMNWDWKTFDFSDPKTFQLLYDGDTKLRGVLNSTDPDIGGFKSAGGKLIHYAGWEDQNIAPRNSVNYYDSVVAMQGSAANTDTFYRLFMIPGMGHC